MNGQPDYVAVLTEVLPVLERYTGMVENEWGDGDEGRWALERIEAALNPKTCTSCRQWIERAPATCWWLEGEERKQPYCDNCYDPLLRAELDRELQEANP